MIDEVAKKCWSVFDKWRILKLKSKSTRCWYLVFYLHVKFSFWAHKSIRDVFSFWAKHCYIQKFKQQECVVQNNLQILPFLGVVSMIPRSKAPTNTPVQFEKVKYVIETVVSWSILDIHVLYTDNAKPLILIAPHYLLFLMQVQYLTFIDHEGLIMRLFICFGIRELSLLLLP